MRIFGKGWRKTSIETYFLWYHTAVRVQFSEPKINNFGSATLFFFKSWNNFCIVSSPPFADYVDTFCLTTFCLLFKTSLGSSDWLIDFTNTFSLYTTKLQYIFIWSNYTGSLPLVQSINQSDCVTVIVVVGSAPGSMPGRQQWWSVRSLMILMLWSVISVARDWSTSTPSRNMYVGVQILVLLDLFSKNRRKGKCRRCCLRERIDFISCHACTRTIWRIGWTAPGR